MAPANLGADESKPKENDMDRITQKMRKAWAFARGRLCALSLFSVVFCCVLYALTLRTNAVYICDGEEIRLAVTLRDHPAEILQDEGIQTLPVDQVSFTGFGGESTPQIEIQRAFPVSVEADGQVQQLQMTGGDVADALEEAGVTLEDQDLVTPQPQTPLEQGTNIQVQRVETKTVEVAEEIPFETVEKATPLLAPGTVRVTRQGAPGERVCTYEETWVDGALQSREKTGEEVTVQPVAQTCLVGANVPVSSTPVATDQNGQPLAYEWVLSNGVATAYSARPGAWTASGLSAVEGTVAVDPDVIPYGSRLYIASPDGSFVYGYAVAADTGTALMDGIIDVDLFFNTYLESCLFGKRTVDIYVLETPAQEDAAPEEAG